MKDSALARARQEMGRYLEAQARAEAARSKGLADDGSANIARRPLRSGTLREALQDAARERLFAPEEEGAMLAHLGRAAASEIFERRFATDSFPPIQRTEVVDGIPTALGTLVDRLPTPGGFRYLEPLGRAVGAFRGQRREAEIEAEEFTATIRKRGPIAVDYQRASRELCARFVESTDDLMLEAISRAAYATGVAPPRRVGSRWSGAETLTALRATPLDSIVAPRSRAPRCAELLGAELRRAMPQRGRLAMSHRRLDPRFFVIAFDAPERIEIIPSPLELGVFSEVEMHRAYGQALALSLIAPALPPALRHPAPASVARTFGNLLTGAYGAAHYTRHSDRKTNEALRWTAQALELVRARALAVSCAPERGLEALARAFMVDPSTFTEGWAMVWPAESWDHEAEIRAALFAPSIIVALRERFDVDWHRNPRIVDTLRAAAGRGGMLSVEAWAAELEVEPEPGAAWLRLTS